MSTNAPSIVIVVMGVSGCGKSTIGEGIAKRLKAHFKDADELHPVVNIQHMASGQPLTDYHRQPWLEKVALYGREQVDHHNTVVIACSALKKQYRAILNQAGNVLYVHLAGSFDTIYSRMRSRTAHFMPESLLQSQFDDLELPTSDERVITLSIEGTLEEIIENAVTAIERHQVR